MLTAHWAGFMKMLLLYIYLIIFVLILISIVLNIYEKRFKQNLLSNQSLEKLKKLNVSRLELKRYVKNTYLGSNMRISPSISKRKEINMESPEQNKVGMLNTLEDELTVYAYIKTLPHEVFTCPFSKENKELLQCIVDKYNISS